MEKFRCIVYIYIFIDVYVKKLSCYMHLLHVYTHSALMQPDSYCLYEQLLFI